MQVTQERFEDAGERDANGFYDFYYSGIVYRFQFPNRVFVVRRYDDTFGEASFLRWESHPDGAPNSFAEIPYQDAEFCAVVAHLCGEEGVEIIEVLLSHGYAQVDVTLLAAS